MAIRQRHVLRTPWLHLLLVVVLFSRAFVPVGYMPGQGGLVLCPAYDAHSALPAMDMPGMDMAATDMGGMDMAVHAVHAGHAGGHHGTHDGGCTYATATAAATLAGGHTAPAIAWLPGAAPDVALPVERPIPRGTIVPTRLPRGPPSLS